MACSLNDNLLEYRVPSVADLPARSDCVIVENADGPGPFGAKGCGEGALAGIVAAIATAVADAGVPVSELPLTPERVWRAINRQDTRAHQGGNDMSRFGRVAVMGTGTMGPGMGAVLARAGMQVSLFDTSAEALETRQGRATTWPGASLTGSRRPLSRADPPPTRAPSSRPSTAPSS